MRSYLHTIENITLQYYFSGNLIDIQYAEAANGAVTAHLSIPTNICVANTDFVLNAPFKVRQNSGFLSDITFTDITPAQSNLDIQTIFEGYTFRLKPSVPKPDSLKFTGLGQFTTELKLSKQRILKPLPALGLYFAVGDFVRLKSHLFNTEGLPTEQIAYSLYVSSIEKTDEAFIIKFEDFQYRLKQIPVRFVTRGEKTMLKFMCDYIIPYILQYTNVDVVYLSKRVAQTFADSNIGRYRVNEASFNKLFLSFMQDYSVNYFYNNALGPGNLLGFVLGERVTRVFNLPIDVENFNAARDLRASVATSFNYKSFTDASILKRSDELNPVVIKIISTQEQLTSSTQNKISPQVIYGDRSALASDTGQGKVVTVKLIGLNEETMKRKALELYTQYKFLAPDNTFTSKNYFVRRQILDYVSKDTIYEKGYYFIREIEYKFTVEQGFECVLKCGSRFTSATELTDVLNQTRLGLDRAIPIEQIQVNFGQ